MSTTGNAHFETTKFAWYATLLGSVPLVRFIFLRHSSAGSPAVGVVVVGVDEAQGGGGVGGDEAHRGLAPIRHTPGLICASSNEARKSSETPSLGGALSAVRAQCKRSALGVWPY